MVCIHALTSLLHVVPSRPMDIHKQWLAAIARTRDKAAFASLFQYFAPRLRAYLLRGGADAIVVEELVQDVMLIVWRGAAEYDPRRAAVSTWIFTIARNRRIDRLRRARRPEPEVGDPHFTPSAPDAPDEHTAETRRAERLRLALQQLPEEQATILHQMYFDGRSQREIAASLNIPLGTVKSRVRLAMSRLRETLAEEVP